MTIIEIFLLILIIAATCLCVYLIYFLKGVSQTLTGVDKTLADVSKDITEIKEKTLPVLDNINEMTEKTANIARDAEAQYMDLADRIQNVKDKFSGLGLQAFQGEKTNPIFELIKKISALSKGLTSFWTNYNK